MECFGGEVLTKEGDGGQKTAGNEGGMAAHALLFAYDGFATKESLQINKLRNPVGLYFPFRERTPTRSLSDLLFKYLIFSR